MSEQISALPLNEVAGSASLGKTKLRLLLTAMRPHQWSKNLFIFAPMLFGLKIADPQAVGYSIVAFLSFCFLASGMYILNDWMDIDEDRIHPEKRNRPLSSGALPIAVAAFGFVILIIGGLASAWLVGPQFLLIAGLYFVMTLAYCLALKNMMILDCMTIAAGFVLRVVGGAVAVGVAASHWLIVCAFLLALFMAFSKRRQEILQLSLSAVKHRSVLSQYTPGYLGHVNVALIAATIVCYALYTVSAETVDRFGTDKLIYGTGFVIYGLLRYMALIENPSKGGNPSKMLIEDIPLLATVVLWALYNATIIYKIAAPAGSVTP